MTLFEVLGFKRVAGLGIGVGLNAVLAGFLYLYLIPSVASRSADLDALRGEVAARRAEAEGLRQEISAFEGQKVAFEELKREGFFGTQDRIMAREKIDEIRNLSKLLSVRYTVDPAVYSSDDLVKKAKHVVVSSPMSVDLDAIEDKDIYRFLYLMETAFPGHMSLEELSMKKNADVTQPILRQIGTGVPVVLVSGHAKLVWRTLLPEDQAVGLVKTDGGGQQ